MAIRRMKHCGMKLRILFRALFHRNWPFAQAVLTSITTGITHRYCSQCGKYKGLTCETKCSQCIDEQLLDFLASDNA